MMRMLVLALLLVCLVGFGGCGPRGGCVKTMSRLEGVILLQDPLEPSRALRAFPMNRDVCCPEIMDLTGVIPVGMQVEYVGRGTGTGRALIGVRAKTGEGLILEIDSAATVLGEYTYKSRPVVAPDGRSVAYLQGSALAFGSLKSNEAERVLDQAVDTVSPIVWVDRETVAFVGVDVDEMAARRKGGYFMGVTGLVARKDGTVAALPCQADSCYVVAVRDDGILVVENSKRIVLRRFLDDVHGRVIYDGGARSVGWPVVPSPSGKALLLRQGRLLMESYDLVLLDVETGSSAILRKGVVPGSATWIR